VISVDNAKANDVLICILSSLLVQKFSIQFVSGNAHIRCLAHVVNLVVQKILSALGEADDPEIKDYFEEFMKDVPIHYDADNDEALKEFENKEDIDTDDDDDLDDDLFTKPVEAEPMAEKSSALQKVCKLQ